LRLDVAAGDGIGDLVGGRFVDRIAPDHRRRRMLAAADARRADDAHAAFAQACERVPQRIGARHLARQRFAHADRQRGRRFLALLHHIEVVVERRDLVNLGHREAQLAGERYQMRGGKMSVAVLDPVQEFDQQIAPARRIAEQCGDVCRSLRVERTSFGTVARAAPVAQARSIDDDGSGHAGQRLQARKSQYFSTCAARSSECWRTRRSASSVSRRSSASMMRM
jgi:hypothetical protein